MHQNLKLFETLMRGENLPDIVFQTFAYYYEQLFTGATGMISEADIAPVENLPYAGDLNRDLQQAGHSAMPRAVLVKLNGGLGTSMGMAQAKSLLPVKNGLRFLDVIARHAIHVGAPLILMNSFATQDDSLEALSLYPELKDRRLGLDFLQHKFPKVRVDNLLPAEHPDDPGLSWNPPGHGDLYTALVTSGLLERLLSAGYEYAFVSNGDNLGATLDAKLLGYFASEDIPFMMEVAQRTPADRKGGHLAVAQTGGLVLRESAQCPDEDVEYFQNIKRHRYFNTNNLWLNLPALAKRIENHGSILGLPLIRNQKTLDPRNPNSTPVFQLETAMGSAISVFEGSRAICVPRTRFSPVKTTNDLLAVRSDAYRLEEDYRIIPVRPIPPNIDLDPAHYRLIDQLDAHFPQGAPSLRECTKLIIKGDVVFGKNVKVVGSVEIVHSSPEQLVIDDDSLLTGA